MSLYNLDFSGWRQGNQAYARGLVNSKTTRAKAEAARMRGLESGIGTIGGLIIGSYLGNPMLGAMLGSKIASGGELSIQDAIALAGGLAGSKGSGMSTPYGDAVDPGQVASSSNMVGGLANLSSAKTGNMYGQWDPTIFTK